MFGAIARFIPQVLPNVSNQTATQVRFKWPDHRMVRDYKRRMLQTQLAPERLRVNSLRKNDILPAEIRELADKQIATFPVDSTPLQIKKRCVITSRPRGVVHKWRLSRIMFRELADHNKIAGVQRAMW